MNKIFGEKKNVEYIDRKGAYIIPIKDGKAAVVETNKGYFFLGGGKDLDETDEDCIIRECMEEVGCKAVLWEYVCSAEAYTEHPQIGFFHPVQSYYLGELVETDKTATEKDHKLVWIKCEELKENLFAEMQNWALNECCKKRSL